MAGDGTVLLLKSGTISIIAIGNGGGFITKEGPAAYTLMLNAFVRTFSKLVLISII
jgi:hypothetical protein